MSKTTTEKWRLTGDDSALEDRMTSITYHFTTFEDREEVWGNPKFAKQWRDIAFCCDVIDELRDRLAEAESDRDRYRTALEEIAIWPSKEKVGDSPVKTARAALEGGTDEHLA